MIVILVLIISFFTLQDSTAQEFHVKKDSVWNLENYMTKDNFVVGVWPHSGRLENPVEAVRLKNTFGFSHVFFTLDKDSAIFKILNKSGFPPDRIMVHINPANYREKIKEYGKVYAYYVDEPFENDLSIEGIKEYIDNYASGSLFIISGYRRTARLNELISRSDGVMFSSYKHWWQCLPGIWCPWPSNDDQRDDWTDMKKRYGEKSFSNWVGAHRDTTEYEVLLQHASNLGLKGIWLYQYQDLENSEKNLLKLSDAAWAAGYMRKFERKYIQEYRCASPKPADCKWFLYKISATEELREIFYEESKVE